MDYLFQNSVCQITIFAVYSRQTLPHASMGTPELDHERFANVIQHIGEILPFSSPEDFQTCVTANLIPSIQEYLHSPTIHNFGREPEDATNSRLDALRAISGLAQLPRGREIFVQTIFSAQRPEKGEMDQRHFDDRMAELLLSRILATENFPISQSITRQFFSSPNLSASERAHRGEVLLRSFQRYYENPWLFQKLSDHPPIIRQQERHILAIRYAINEFGENIPPKTIQELFGVYTALDPTAFDNTNRYQAALRKWMKKDALQYFDVDAESALAVLDKFSAQYLAPNLKEIEIFGMAKILSAIMKKAQEDPSKPFFDHAIGFLTKAAETNPVWGANSLELLRYALAYTRQSEDAPEYIERLTHLHANTNQDRPPALFVCDLFNSIWNLRLSKSFKIRSAIAFTLTHTIGENTSVKTYLLGLLHPEETFSDELSDQYPQALPPANLELMFAIATDQMKTKLLEKGVGGNPRWVELMNTSLYPYVLEYQTEQGREEYENTQYLLARAAYQSLYTQADGDSSGQISCITAIYTSLSNPVWVDGIGTLNTAAQKELRTMHRIYCDFIELNILKKIAVLDERIDQGAFFQTILHFLQYRQPSDIQNNKMEKLQALILNRVIRTHWFGRINNLLKHYTPDGTQLNRSSVRYLRNNLRKFHTEVQQHILPLLPNKI